MWDIVASIAGPIIGGLIGADSASDAGEAQASATREAAGLSSQSSQTAIDEQRRQFDISQQVLKEQQDYERQQYERQRADVAPYREAGTSALASLKELLSGGSRAFQPFTLADFWSDPVTKASYQSGLDLGAKAIENMARSRGSLNSGATMKELTRFGTDYTGNQAAGSEARFRGNQRDEFGRLATVAGFGTGAGPGAPGGTAGAQANLGATTAGNIGNISMAGANTVGNLLTGGANARGAAAIAGGNALSGGINSVSNWWNQQRTLDKVLGAVGGRGYTPPSSEWADAYRWNY